VNIQGYRDTVRVRGHHMRTHSSKGSVGSPLSHLLCLGVEDLGVQQEAVHIKYHVRGLLDCHSCNAVVLL